MNKSQNDDKKKQLLRAEYMARINRVIDYIEDNIYQELSLEKLAEVADFSRFHFHRIFSALVGETLNRFIQRIRVEKAAMQLQAYPHKSITDIAFDCGFSGSAAFARVFKETFGKSAGEWRDNSNDEQNRICAGVAKESPLRTNRWAHYDITSSYLPDEKYCFSWKLRNRENSRETTIQVKEMPRLNVAYLRHIGPYKGNSDLFEELFMKLMKWAGPRGLIRFPDTWMLSVYHDDPGITDEEKLRLSVCLTVPPETKVDGEIGKMTVPGGTYAVARVEVASNEFEEAWRSVMGAWLPESGYQPDNSVSYELYHNNCADHPEKKHIVDICVPVKPL